MNKKNADDTVERLLAEAKRQKLTPQQMADRSGITYAACWRLLNREFSRPSAELVIGLMNALNCTMELTDTKTGKTLLSSRHRS